MIDVKYIVIYSHDGFVIVFNVRYTLLLFPDTTSVKKASTTDQTLDFLGASCLFQAFF